MRDVFVNNLLPFLCRLQWVYFTEPGKKRKGVWTVVNAVIATCELWKLRAASSEQSWTKNAGRCKSVLTIIWNGQNNVWCFYRTKNRSNKIFWAWIGGRSYKAAVCCSRPFLLFTKPWETWNWEDGIASPQEKCLMNSTNYPAKKVDFRLQIHGFLTIWKQTNHFSRKGLW